MQVLEAKRGWAPHLPSRRWSEDGGEYQKAKKDPVCLTPDYMLWVGAALWALRGFGGLWWWGPGPKVKPCRGQGPRAAARVPSVSSCVAPCHWVSCPHPSLTCPRRTRQCLVTRSSALRWGGLCTGEPMRGYTAPAVCPILSDGASSTCASFMGVWRIAARRCELHGMVGGETGCTCCSPGTCCTCTCAVCPYVPE
jgi:hypothetical protein